MSIEKVKISRTLVVNSPIHLWKLIKTKDEILQLNSHLNIFCYYVDRYLNGCRCDDESNKETINNEYQIIKNTSTLVEFIKTQFNCNTVIFNNNDW